MTSRIIIHYFTKTQEATKTTDRDTRAPTVAGGAPLSCGGGERLPASYVNYLLVNGDIVIPSLVSSVVIVMPRRGKVERIFIFACRAATAAVAAYLSNSQPSSLPPRPPLTGSSVRS